MARRYVPAGSLLIVALVNLFSPTDSVFAQQDRSKSRPSGREAYESANTRNRNLQNRQLVLEHVGDEDKKGNSGEQLKNLLSKMREDFRRLQVVNNSMMSAAAEQKTLDYKRVEEATDEINKCAKRLQVFLPMPDGDDKKDDKKENEFSAQQMKPALFRLDDLVMSFVKSPLFRNLVDTESADKARRDLSGIIELSGAIRKNAEKLGKASPKL
jgi:hypothetical protein